MFKTGHHKFKLSESIRMIKSIVFVTVCALALLITVSTANMNKQKAQIGEQAVKLMYQFVDLQQLQLNMIDLKSITTEPVFNQLTIDNEDRTLYTYMKFKGITTSVNIKKATSTYIIYSIVTIEDHNKILVKLSNYMNQLALSKKDMVVCYLGWEVAPITDDVFFKRIPDHRFQDLLFVEINPDTFEPSLRLLLSSRTAILKRDDIIDIIGCYQNSTIMQGSLYEFMQARGFNLDRHLVESLEESPLVSLDDIITDFGEESAVEISNAISEFRNAQDEPNYLEQADLQKYVRTSWDKSASMAALVSAVLFIASVFVFLLKLPGLGIIFAVFGILQARHLALIYKTGLATVFTWLNCASLIFGVIQLIGTLSPNIIEFLQKMLLIQR